MNKNMSILTLCLHVFALVKLFLFINPGEYFSERPKYEYMDKRKNQSLQHNTKNGFPKMAMGWRRGQIYRNLKRMYHQMETLEIEKYWKTPAKMGQR